jgi:hypothetical protein
LHELAFADVCCPERQVVLKLPLRDFCIGHRLILLRQRNPLAWMPEAEFNLLPFATQVFWLLEAVYVCGQSYAHRKQLEQGAGVLDRFLNWFKVKAWHRRRRREDTDWALELANFRNYLNTARLITDYKGRRDGFPFMPIGSVPDSKGRSLGAPHDASLLQFLIRELRLTPTEAHEFPMALAEMHYLSWLEREGGIRILNAFETEFEEYCQAEDKKAAALKTKTKEEKSNG